MKIYTLAALALCACATTSGKTAKPTPQERTAGEFYPLDPGTSWTYERKFLGATEQMTVTTLKAGPGFAEDSTGAKLVVDRYGLRDDKRYLLRNPIANGTTWSNVVSVSSVEHYQILVGDQPCDAPAGAWEHCVVVESRNRVEEGVFLLNETTFAPGVGIVRVASTLEAKDGRRIPQMTLLLLKYVGAPKPPPPTAPAAKP